MHIAGHTIQYTMTHRLTCHLIREYIITHLPGRFQARQYTHFHPKLTKLAQRQARNSKVFPTISNSLNRTTEGSHQLS
jgi:hypothetical protein